MRISTRTHAFLDVATSAFALAFPRMLGASDRFTKVVTAVAMGKLGYTLFTRHELGVIKILPMEAHLALDAVGGAVLCALPMALDETDNAALTACAVGLGLFDIAAAPITDTESAADFVRFSKLNKASAPREQSGQDRQSRSASVAMPRMH